jgi:hypothetical protein
VSIIAQDFKQPDALTGHRLAVFFGTGFEKGFELNYGRGYYARYGITSLPVSSEANPLVLVRRNEGGSRRTITYDLYRLERDRLKQLWQWSDSFSHSTSEPYSISTLDFSGMRDQKRFTVYSTYGNRRQIFSGHGPHSEHRVTSFAWNPTADAFVEFNTDTRVLR